MTIPPSRSAATEPNPADPSGDAIAEILTDAGYVVTARRTVPDDYVRIKMTVIECLDRFDVGVVTISGARTPWGATADVGAAAELRQLRSCGSIIGVSRWGSQPLVPKNGVVRL